ncbi:MAG: aspartyl/asparaginyl beta-hydroxylase domain-containing protein, partial [Cyanobacteria bacterium P01_A01_bin.84]
LDPQLIKEDIECGNPGRVEITNVPAGYEYSLNSATGPFQTDPFFDTKQFQLTSYLESNWVHIKQEFYKIQQEKLIDWPEKNLYNQGWKIFSLYAFKNKNKDNCLLCPQTTQLIEKIPNIVSAGFSCLSPGTQISPHSGFSGYSELILRCHLGLIIPDKCAIRVGNQTQIWQEGKCLIFDDSVEHEAWNLGKFNRIILLIDFIKPNIKNHFVFKKSNELDTSLQNFIVN